jgi:hypothetical protein
MKTRRVLVFVSTACLAAACGSRTGLLVPSHHDAGEPVDATEEADVLAEAGPDVTEEPDVAEEPDAEEEPDAVEEDVFFPPDAPDICPDAGSTVIYVVTMDGLLMSFYPPTASFTTIGTVNCPDPGGTEPFSMAVSRQGVAYVVYSDGNLFRVSTKTAQCGPTSFIPNNDGFPTTFGMGFAADVGDAGMGDEAGETLYLAGDTMDTMGNSMPVILGSLNTTTFVTHTIGTVPVILSELTGTGGGQLYGFFPTAQPAPGIPAAIGQIDKTTGQLLSSVTLPAINIEDGWAFAFWGGDFYTFTAPDMADTLVQRYRPSDGTVVDITTLTGHVVDGAGVSTCAPQM